MTVHAVQFHARDLQSRLESLQQTWPKGPISPALLGGGTAKLVFTRWSGVIEDEPFEIASNFESIDHVITLPLRPSNVFHTIGSTTINNGPVGPGHIYLCGPITQQSRAIYREGFDVLRLHLAGELLTEAIEGTCGRDARCDIELFGPHFVDDRILLHLSMAAVAAGEDAGAIGSAYFEAVGLALATHMVGRYYSGFRSPPPKSAAPLASWRLKRVVDYVESHLAHDISLADLAAVAGLSRMHFAAQFKSATSSSPHTYILQRRVTAARRLLLDSGVSIQQVALAVGFKSHAHFINAFRRIVGESPGRWRQTIGSC